jgi:hypothetical protein
MAIPTKSIVLVDSNQNLEMISGCLSLEVTGEGRITLRNSSLVVLGGCDRLLLRDITDKATHHTLTLKATVRPGSGSCFVHHEILGWYPSCNISNTCWLGDAVSPVGGTVYPYENAYATAQAQGVPTRIPTGLEPRELTLEILPNGALRLQTKLSQLMHTPGPAEPVTGAPDAYSVMLGVVGDAVLTVEFGGLSATAPAALKTAMTVSKEDALIAKQRPRLEKFLALG